MVIYCLWIMKFRKRILFGIVQKMHRKISSAYCRRHDRWRRVSMEFLIGVATCFQLFAQPPQCGLTPVAYGYWPNAKLIILSPESKVSDMSLIMERPAFVISRQLLFCSNWSSPGIKNTLEGVEKFIKVTNTLTAQVSRFCEASHVNLRREKVTFWR